MTHLVSIVNTSNHTDDLITVKHGNKIVTLEHGEFISTGFGDIDISIGIRIAATKDKLITAPKECHHHGAKGIAANLIECSWDTRAGDAVKALGRESRGEYKE